MAIDLPEAELVEIFFKILTDRATTPAIRGLRIRLQDVGSNRDELIQFRNLQRACREDPELDQEFTWAGLGSLLRFDPLTPDPDMGILVQAFNQMVEDHWEGRTSHIHLPRIEPGKTPDNKPTQGHVMVVKINAARDLVVRDILSSDPYCKLIYRDPAVPAMAQRHQSSTQKNTLDPIWAEERKFSGVTRNGTLRVEVWDEDKLSDDDPMGWVEIAMRDLDFNQGSDAWLHLKDVEKGQIHINHTF